jgi:hypothetical protein
MQHGGARVDMTAMAVVLILLRVRRLENALFLVLRAAKWYLSVTFCVCIL